MTSDHSKQEISFLLKVGSKIRTLRLAKGLSQEIFAQKCKLDRTYISDAERGQRNLSLLTLRKMQLPYQ